jgi:hypothetical protein
LDVFKKEVKDSFKEDLNGFKKEVKEDLSAIAIVSHNTAARWKNAFVDGDDIKISHLYTPEGELPTDKCLTFKHLKKLTNNEKHEILVLYGVDCAKGKSDKFLRKFMGLPHDDAGFYPSEF